MDLLVQSNIAYSSRSIRKMASIVFAVLFVVQAALLFPNVVGFYSEAHEDLVSFQRDRLYRLAVEGRLQTRADLESQLDNTVVQLSVVSGLQPAAQAGSSGLLSRLVARRTNLYIPVQERPGEARSINARLDTTAVVTAALRYSFGLLSTMFLVSLVGGLVTLWISARLMIWPVQSLSKAIRMSRAENDGGVPEPIDFTASDDLNPLVTEFNGLIEQQRNAARLVQVKQQYLEFAAHHDDLTKLPNRTMFDDALKARVDKALREETHFAVFLVDLDNFKFFNDQYGHQVGDAMVTEIGNRLRTLIRGNDVVARLDGDEFAVIVENVEDKAHAEEMAGRLMNEATAPFEYRGFTLKVAVTVGISRFPEDAHLDDSEESFSEEIVNNASVALQEAKVNGKNQYQFFTESMRSRLTARIRLEQDLKVAMQEWQFEVWYQPKINIRTRQITGAEALVRWKHPQKGFISPEIFVPVAEEAGLIIDLGEQILRTACRQTRQLQKLGYAGLNVAVNISAVQFTDGNLLPMVRRALADTRLTPSLLELEITESAVMHDPDEVIHSLHELSRFGMRLAIDDFGTGYSSLAYLKRFPVNTLKIDRAFITDISSDNDDVAIVEAVLGLGRHFNMKVVAEGVEDEAQLAFLHKQGCDLAQGYYISKPLNFKDYVSWLQAWPHGVQAPERPAVRKAS